MPEFLPLVSSTRATVICNPVSGTRDVRALLPNALEALRACGWQVDLQTTTQRGDAGRLAAQARDQGQHVVLAAGGDGTLNEIANALALSEVALGVLPSGTANVWARQIGLPIPTVLRPDGLIEAARLMSRAIVRPIDLGRAADRYFMLWSGIGLDAHVTASIEPRPPWLKRLGMVGYALRAFGIALQYRGTRMVVIIDGQRIKCRALMVLISNIRLYGGFVVAAPNAILDDGLLDVYLVKGNSFVEATHSFVNVLLGRTSRDPQIVSRRGRHISIAARRKCPVHVDAEPFGRTPISIEVVPKALRVLIPAGAPASLFSNQA